jgi:hypothetical protein
MRLYRRKNQYMATGNQCQQAPNAVNLRPTTNGPEGYLKLQQHQKSRAVSRWTRYPAF